MVIVVSKYVMVKIQSVINYIQKAPREDDGMHMDRLQLTRQLF